MNVGSVRGGFVVDRVRSGPSARAAAGGGCTDDVHEEVDGQQGEDGRGPLDGGDVDRRGIGRCDIQTELHLVEIRREDRDAEQASDDASNLGNAHETLSWVNGPTRTG